jgi:putative toxin-antitoxin system antitoxin component (TIGR02293 family)
LLGKVPYLHFIKSSANKGTMKTAEHGVKGKGNADSKAPEHSAKGRGATGGSVSDINIAGRATHGKNVPVEEALNGTYKRSPASGKPISAQVATQSNQAHKKVSTRQKPKPVISLRDIPGKIEDSAVLSFLSKKEINWYHIEAIKALAGIDYVTISNWLNIDVKTLRKWKNPAYKFKPEDQEKMLLLIILFKHGIDVFGSPEEFRQWLYSDNFYFGKKQPSSFLNTGTGIRFVDNSLTAIEYGDNA